MIDLSWIGSGSRAVLRAAACLAFGAVLGACSSDSPPSGEEPAGSGPADSSVVSQIEIPVRDFVFDARVAGPEDGEVVFLLHGFPQTSYEWRYALPELGKAGFRAIAPDQRGYSPRARPADVAEYSVLTLAQDVVDMADALGVKKFHVVGHDWGAGIAWALAGLQKERVTSLAAVSIPHPDAFTAVLSDPASCQYSASSYFDFFITPAATDFFVADGAAGLRATYEGLSAEDIQVYVDALGTPEAIDGGLAWYRANIENRAFKSPPLGPVRVPTLFVWSSGDAFVCHAGAELTQNYVETDYEYMVIPGVGHWVVELAHEEFNAALLSHLREFSGSAP